MGEGRGGRIIGSTSPLLLAGAAGALGILLQFTNGSVPPGLMSRAMGGLSLVVLLCAAGCLGFAWKLRSTVDASRLQLWLIAALAVQLLLFFFKPPALSLPLTDRSWMVPVSMGVMVVALAVWLGLRRQPMFGRALTPIAMLVFITLGIWVIRHTPDPGIDVVTFQREGLRALSQGENPYAISMPQVYGNPEYYGEGLVANGRLLIGVPYPPLGLLLEWPFHVLFGDYRYALLLALAAAALLLSRIRSDLTGALAATLLLFMPRTLFVVEQGWTEPLVVLALAGVVYSAIRRPSWLPLTLGALFAMKQYTIFLAPIALFLVPASDRRKTAGVLALALLTAAVITLPFVLWNPHAFYRSVVEFQFLQPFREDSLSYLAWFERITGSAPRSWVGFAMMFGAMAVVVWRAPRTVAGFAAGGALILLAFFAFNKQAFCNYYFVVVGALWSAVAARDRGPGSSDPGKPRT